MPRSNSFDEAEEIFVIDMNDNERGEKTVKPSPIFAHKVVQYTATLSTTRRNRH